MQVLLFKNDILNKIFNNVINNIDSYTLIDDDVKMEISIIPNVIIIRENDEYLFKLDILNKTCTYRLKEYNLVYDIKVLNSNYINNGNEIIIEYSLETDEDLTKVIIKNEG